MLLASFRVGYTPVLAVDGDRIAINSLTKAFPEIKIATTLDGLDPLTVPSAEIMLIGEGNLAGLEVLIDKTKPRLVISETKKDISAILKNVGYAAWVETLNASGFGVPQKRKRLYMVAFRPDLRIKFVPPFPFPEEDRPKPLSLILETGLPAEPMPGKKGQGPNTPGPAFPTNYHRDTRAFLIETGNGLRKLTVLEAKRIMGFPDAWPLPEGEKEAYRLLGKTQCVPVVETVIKEAWEWTAF